MHEISCINIALHIHIFFFPEIHSYLNKPLITSLPAVAPAPKTAALPNRCTRPFRNSWCCISYLSASILPLAGQQQKQDGMCFGMFCLCPSLSYLWMTWVLRIFRILGLPMVLFQDLLVLVAEVFVFISHVVLLFLVLRPFYYERY